MPLERLETLIIGGGQAGLAMSHMLRRRGRPHLKRISRQFGGRSRKGETSRAHRGWC
jgi:cation diffusion facilitator CzcD-associated flavoprotein CzcO